MLGAPVGHLKISLGVMVLIKVLPSPQWFLLKKLKKQLEFVLVNLLRILHFATDRITSYRKKLKVHFGKTITLICNSFFWEYFPGGNLLQQILIFYWSAAADCYVESIT
jgi:hypothetical protein